MNKIPEGRPAFHVDDKLKKAAKKCAKVFEEEKLPICGDCGRHALEVKEVKGIKLYQCPKCKTVDIN